MRARRACWPRATGTRGSARSTTASTREFVNFERNVGVTGWRLDVAPRVGLRLVGARILRAPVRRLSLHAVLAEGPGAGHRRLADALACRSHRSMPGLVFERAVGLARPAAHDARAARALSVHAVPRAERPAAVRHRPARPEPGAAVPHQPLRRRRPRQRRQPDRVRPHEPPVQRRQRARNTSRSASARLTTSRSRAWCCRTNRRRRATPPTSSRRSR